MTVNQTNITRLIDSDLHIKNHHTTFNNKVFITCYGNFIFYCFDGSSNTTTSKYGLIVKTIPANGGIVTKGGTYSK